jgi:hypothetical protein
VDPLNWLYIVVRTFPFWGIPLGIVFIGTGLRAKGKKKYLLLGVVLVVGGVGFFFFQGHFLAVPFLHTIFSPNPR